LETEWFKMCEFRFRSSVWIVCWEWASYCEQTLSFLNFLWYDAASLRLWVAEEDVLSRPFLITSSHITSERLFFLSFHLCFLFHPGCKNWGQWICIFFVFLLNKSGTFSYLTNEFDLIMVMFVILITVIIMYAWNDQ